MGRKKEQAPEIQADEQLEQEEAAQNPSQPTEEGDESCHPPSAVYSQNGIEKTNPSLKILLYCLLCIVILMLIGYFFKMKCKIKGFPEKLESPLVYAGDVLIF